MKILHNFTKKSVNQVNQMLKLIIFFYIRYLCIRNLGNRAIEKIKDRFFTTLTNITNRKNPADSHNTKTMEISLKHFSFSSVFLYRNKLELNLILNLIRMCR